MYEVSNKVELVYKLNPTVFQVLNREIFEGSNPKHPLGASIGAIKTITVEHEEMLKMLMPSIIGTHPTDVRWYKDVEMYWNNINISVPIGGLTLETGFRYDINDSKRRNYINELQSKLGKLKEPKTLATDKELGIYVEANIDWKEKYKYGSPINTAEYLTWVYSLGHRKVANNPTDVENSTHIEFTLVDQKAIREAKLVSHTISNKALEKYLALLGDRSKVNNILYVYGEDPSILENIDADFRLKQYCESNPTKFIEVVDDTALQIKGKIERYIHKNILRRLPDTAIIVDGSDNGVVIGNNMDEAVAFFNSQAADKIARVSEYTTKYQALKQIKQ